MLDDIKNYLARLCVITPAYLLGLTRLSFILLTELELSIYMSPDSLMKLEILRKKPVIQKKCEMLKKYKKLHKQILQNQKKSERVDGWI